MMWLSLSWRKLTIVRGEPNLEIVFTSDILEVLMKLLRRANQVSSLIAI